MKAPKKRDHRSTLEAEQNRLIVENRDLAKIIAAGYRGSKGIPFEDLVAEGYVGLVEAARNFDATKAKFVTYASHRIHSAILNFIEAWQPLTGYTEKPLSPADDGVWRDWYEWDEYPHCTAYERWTRLDNTPEGLMMAWDELKRHRQFIDVAVAFLPPLDRSVFKARYFRDPSPPLHAIAREYKISYRRTVRILDRALNQFTEIVSKRVLAAG